jgi:hypothetical protein
VVAFAAELSESMDSVTVDEIRLVLANVGEAREGRGRG